MISPNTEVPGSVIGYWSDGRPIKLIAGGSVDAGTEGNQNDQSQPQPWEPSSSGGVHPAWNPLLSAIPQELHPRVTPILQDWSKGVDKGFQDVHARYAPFKPFVEQQVDPEILQAAYGLFQQVEADPVEFYRALETFLKEGGQLEDLQDDGQDTSQDGMDQDQLLQARMDELNDRDEVIAEYLVQQQQAQIEADEEDALDEELADAHERFSKQHGYDFDDMYVLARLEAGSELEDAVGEFYSMMNQHLQNSNRPRAPQLLGSGGSLPTNQVHPKDMSEGDLNKFVAAYLEQNAQQR
jgi:hypothetical protein